MAAAIRYTAMSWRDETAWVVRVAQLDRSTRVTRLSDLEAVTRRFIGSLTADDPDQIRLSIELRVPDGVNAALEAATAVRTEVGPGSVAGPVPVPMLALHRALARRLIEHGYALREVAVLLGVSYPRARQLAAEPPEPVFSGAGSTSTTVTGAVPGARTEAEPPFGAQFGAQFGAEIRPHTGYQHEALFYRDDAQFLAGTVGFVQEAVRLRQPVMVALPKPRLELLRTALGPGGDGNDGEVFFVDMAELGGNPARILPGWLSFVEEYSGPGRPVRGIGEPQWPGRRPQAAVECQFHEGLLNLAIDPDLPLWLRCLYDVGALAGPLIEAARCSHPVLVEDGEYRGSTRYGGLHHVNSMFRSELPPPPADSARLAFGGSDLSTLRARVTGIGQATGLDRDRTQALTLAVAEIAANCVRHGGGQGQLLTWVQPGALVCEVTDPGRLGSPLAGRRRPPPEEVRGRGLWLANQFSDLVQIRSTARGTTARIFTWL